LCGDEALEAVANVVNVVARRRAWWRGGERGGEAASVVARRRAWWRGGERGGEAVSVVARRWRQL
jgi:hypothetical protein